MKSCLSGATDKKTIQKQRMNDCNFEAAEKALKGDAHKTFMKTCLSGKPG